MKICGFITGQLNDCKKQKPQKKFKVIKYYKSLEDIEEEEEQQKNYIGHGPIPKAVCQSINHIFFLYDDYLVIQNKLTDRIIHSQKLLKPFKDMYYNQLLNGIKLYNENGISKISLKHEFEYLFEDYIEIGKYKPALTLSKDNKMIRPKIHKIYGDYLFEQKRFMKAAQEYAYSDEIFEHVCLKFLSTNNNLALLKNLLIGIYENKKVKILFQLLKIKEKIKIILIHYYYIIY